MRQLGADISGQSVDPYFTDSYHDPSGAHKGGSIDPVAGRLVQCAGSTSESLLIHSRQPSQNHPVHRHDFPLVHRDGVTDFQSFDIDFELQSFRVHQARPGRTLPMGGEEAPLALRHRLIGQSRPQLHQKRHHRSGKGHPAQKSKSQRSSVKDRQVLSSREPAI